jgi:hypothetical protein
MESRKCVEIRLAPASRRLMQANGPLHMMNWPRKPSAVCNDAGFKKQIADHALPQEGFGLSTPKGTEEQRLLKVNDMLSSLLREEQRQG